MLMIFDLGLKTATYLNLLQAVDLLRCPTAAFRLDVHSDHTS